MVWTNSRNLQNNTKHIKNVIGYMLNSNKTEGIIALASNGTPETFYEESRLLVRQWELAKKKDLKTQAISFVTSHEVKQEGLKEEQAKKYLKTDHDLMQKLVGKDKMVLSSIHKSNKRGEGEYVEDGYVHIHHLVITINTEQITAPILSTKHDFLWDKVADTFIKAYPEEETIKRNYRAEMRYRRKYNHQKNEVLKQIKDGKAENIDNFKTSPYKFTIYDHKKLNQEITESSGSELSETQKQKKLNQRKKIYAIETEIDDAVETVKENYKNGDCKYCNYRQFTYEMKKRGYKTALKEGHLTVQPYQNSGNTGMIHFKNPKSEPQKFEGYTKEDIESRLANEGKFKDWTPKHIEIYTIFDTNHQYYKDKSRNRELKQAQYKNYCQYRRLARLTDTLIWIAGGDPISSVIVIGLVLILMSLLYSEKKVKSTIKEIAETYQTNKFKKAIDRVSTPKNEEVDNKYQALLNQFKNSKKSISIPPVNKTTTISTKPVTFNKENVFSDETAKTVIQKEDKNNLSENIFDKKTNENMTIFKDLSNSGVEFDDNIDDNSGFELSDNKFDDRLEDIIFNIKSLSEQADSAKKNEGNKSPLYKIKNEQRNKWIELLNLEYPNFKSQVERWRGPNGDGFTRTFSPKNIVEFYENDAYDTNKKPKDLKSLLSKKADIKYDNPLIKSDDDPYN